MLSSNHASRWGHSHRQSHGPVDEQTEWSRTQAILQETTALLQSLLAQATMSRVQHKQAQHALEALARIDAHLLRVQQP